MKLKIWGHALEEPQLVAIQSLSDDGKNTIPLRSHSPLLRVNKEARKAALKVYTLLYDVPDRTPKIYINLGVDILWIPHYDPKFLQGLQPEVRRKIKRLALGVDFAYGDECVDPELYYENAMQEHLSHQLSYMDIDEFYIAMGKSEDVNAPDVVFLEPRSMPLEIFPVLNEFYPSETNSNTCPDWVDLRYNYEWSTYCPSYCLAFDDLSRTNYKIERIKLFCR
jgi:hypothetical protein